MKWLHTLKLSFFSLMTTLGYQNQTQALPENFVYLKYIDSTIVQEIKYYSSDNFMGRQVIGYDAPTCILTYQAAAALSKLQKQLQSKGMGIKVFDCYRPSRSVEDFISWSYKIEDQQQKQTFYPRINKADLFKLGYIAKKSSHSQGSTVDLTLVRFEQGNPIELNMGTPFDFLDTSSHFFNEKISIEAKQNRLLLRKLMSDVGFKPIGVEWWHFTLGNAPFPHTYFNFPITKENS